MLIGIIDNIGPNYNKYLKDESYGLGGSETWTVQISKEFANKHISVKVYCYVKESKIDSNNVEYIPIKEFDYNKELPKFDYIIITRSLCNTLEIIKKTNCCNNVYLMTHEPAIFDNQWEINYNVYNDKISNYKFLKKILILSNFCKDVFISQYKIPENIMVLTANGFNFDLFPNTDIYPKDNSILWSTEFNRHFDDLGEHIAPLIVKKIPDFKIYTCSHIDSLPEKYNNCDYIINLGKLNKIDLYKEMNKHACFFYTNKAWESFCNTAVEAALCNNDIIMPLREGPETVFAPFKEYFMDGEIYFSNKYEFQYAADLIVDSILHYDKRKTIRSNIKKFIKDNYNWPTIVNKLLIEFENNK